VRIRPRLLVGSLLAALAVIAVYAWTQRPDDHDAGLDARLDDPQTVITYPNDGLGNDALAGERLPEVMLLADDDSEVSTADMLGAPMVVNLWYSSCAPCAAELSEFAEVDAETHDVVFLGVNPEDSVKVMNQFAGERGVEYPLYRDDAYRLTDELGIVAFPVTLFVTSDGVIVEQTGALDADELRSKIDNLRQIDQAAT